MTRKDYVLIAEALKDARTSAIQHVGGAGTEAPFVHGINAAAYTIVRALEVGNPRFDRARFLKAAGVEG